MSARLRLRLAVTVIALTGVSLSAQVPTIESLQSGTASISGRVVEAQSGEPLGNVRVGLTAPRILGVRSATTDAAGAYQFTGLTEHEYHVHVMDPLYLHTCHGATDVMQLGCGAVALLRNQQRTGIDLRLTRTAILRGVVLDDAGRPVGGANLAARSAPSVSPMAMLSGTQTKPDGTFEMSLAGGDWVLSLDMPVTADKPRPPTVFYPGVAGADDAEVIRVTAGLVTSGLTFRFPKIANRSLTARISLPATGGNAVRAFLYRVEPRMRREIALDADGAGTVPGLLEGRYHVAAQADLDGRGLVASDVAHVVQDGTEIALLLSEPGRITGKVVAERGGLPSLADVRVAANWIDDEGEEIDPVTLSETMLAPDASFSFDGVFGLRRLQLMGLPPEWRVQSIRRGRTDAGGGVDVPAGATIDVTIIIARQ